MVVGADTVEAAVDSTAGDDVAILVEGTVRRLKAVSAVENPAEVDKVAPT